MLYRLGQALGFIAEPSSLREAVTWGIERDSIEYVSRSGARFHRVDAHGAWALAPAVIVAAAAPDPPIPLAYFMAVVCQECRFDVQVTNPNLTRRSPTQDEEQMAWLLKHRPDLVPQAGNLARRRELLDILYTDWGAAQISGHNLLSQRIEVSQAMDPAFSLPRMAFEYRVRLDWAKSQQFQRSGRPLPVDPLQAATLAYNKGYTGATLILEQRTDPAVAGYRTAAELAEKMAAGWQHVRSVMKHYRRYLSDLRHFR